MARLFRTFLLLVVSSVFGIISAEAYMRWSEGYQLLSWRLAKAVAGYGIYPGEIRYLYNRSFRTVPMDETAKDEPGVFDPVKRFGEDTEFPRYMFKPDYRLALSGGVFVPVGQEHANVIWESNERGFRGESFPWNEVGTRDLRVIAVGGSVTEGQVALEETYPYRLEQLLSGMLPARKVEVLNAGFAGLGPADMLALTRLELMRYQPDYVVYFDAGNGLDPFNSFEITPRPENLSAWGYDHSAIWRGLLRRFEKPIPGGTYVSDRSRPNPSLDAYLDQLAALVDIVEAAEAQFLLIAPVVGYNNESWTDHHVPLDVYWLHEWWNPISPQHVLDDHYRVTAEAMRKFAEDRSLPFLDLQDIMGSDPANFYRFGQILDLGHFSGAGNLVIAGAIARWIREDVDTENPGARGEIRKPRSPEG